MSKRSPGPKAAMKKGKEIHDKERARAREKRKNRESLSEVFTEVLNEIGQSEEKK